MRYATVEDLPAIVALLADDQLGAAEETPADPGAYRAAFDRVTADPKQHLMVADGPDGVLGTLQLTVVPGLSRRGAARSVLEAVHVSAEARGAGLGTRLVEWAVTESRRQGCDLIELTTDATRLDTHRFYERLGFEASALGFTLPL
ncbi:GNAT family N-acetyltransferase [Streptomyces sp. AJS327]|nr:GNAT family N-acetyltransferase [Streptomyces sp. AJS327]